MYQEFKNITQCSINKHVAKDGGCPGYLCHDERNYNYYARPKMDFMTKEKMCVNVCKKLKSEISYSLIGPKWKKARTGPVGGPTVPPSQRITTYAIIIKRIFKIQNANA
jgi:hypothetical protein